MHNVFQQEPVISEQIMEPEAGLEKFGVGVLFAPDRFSLHRYIHFSIGHAWQDDTKAENTPYFQIGTSDHHQAISGDIYHTTNHLPGLGVHHLDRVRRVLSGSVSLLQESGPFLGVISWIVSTPATGP